MQLADLADADDLASTNYKNFTCVDQTKRRRLVSSSYCCLCRNFNKYFTSI
jgi:hypothetical protein